MVKTKDVKTGEKPGTPVVTEVKRRTSVLDREATIALGRGGYGGFNRGRFSQVLGAGRQM